MGYILGTRLNTSGCRRFLPEPLSSLSAGQCGPVSLRAEIQVLDVQCQCVCQHAGIYPSFSNRRVRCASGRLRPPLSMPKSAKTCACGARVCVFVSCLVFSGTLESVDGKKARRFDTDIWSRSQEKREEVRGRWLAWMLAGVDACRLGRWLQSQGRPESPAGQIRPRSEQFATFRRCGVVQTHSCRHEKA